MRKTDLLQLAIAIAAATAGIWMTPSVARDGGASALDAAAIVDARAPCPTLEGTSASPNSAEVGTKHARSADRPGTARIAPPETR